MAKRTTRTRRSTRPPQAADNTGPGGETHHVAAGDGPRLTTNDGLVLSDNQNSLRAHVRGPSLLEDVILQEKIASFDRERIPERVVHARGVTARGTFELTESLEAHTTARVLTEVGGATPVLARFSTVVGSAGSADTVRDVRGFAVKFLTEEGTWDLVGNNVPVFFIQDAMKFPDLVHAVKREPDRGFPSASSAHDTFWDFVSLMPESLHMLLWLMSDRTLPRYLRTMEGFAVHSFRLIDADGAVTFVKFHWRPTHGLASLVWDEAVALAGADPDFHRRDLWEAIEAGMFPAWDLAVQLFTAEEADAWPFDHLDPTKLVPEELVPLRVIGRMTLDRNVEDVFTENEQAAFCPSRLVPGIDVSDDPLLQGRLFSYLDTQLHRVGPNVAQLPVNAPLCPVANFQRDGALRAAQRGRVSYEPSSLDPLGPREHPEGFRSGPGVPAPADPVGKTRVRSARFADHLSQARQFWRSQSDPERSHIVAAFAFELGKVETPAVRARVVAWLRAIDDELGVRVATTLGLFEVPEAATPVVVPVDLPVSPALQLLGKAEPTLLARHVGILVADGTDATVLEALQEAVETAGGNVVIVAPGIGDVTLSDRTRLPVDRRLDGSPSACFDAIAIVLQASAAADLAGHDPAKAFARDAFNHLKGIAVDAGGQALLAAAGLPVDGGVDTGVVDAAEADTFATVAATRHLDREARVRHLP